MSTSSLPRSFGPYLLLRRLATGGMAEVYLARARGEGGFEKPVAIKRIHPNGASSAGCAPSLADEAKLSAALDHPNIVQTFDLGREGESEYLVMEHIEGRDVQRVLDVLCRTDRTFPIDLAAHVVAEVCRGLAYAHAAKDGLVHRDISPQNILLSFAGEVKIADFGIAQTRARRSDPEARVIKGKYFYMSPEQARAERLDLRSDVFSAGVVLWELLAGRRLYSEPDVARLLEAVRRADVPPPSSVRPQVPVELDAVIARATAPSRERRYANASAMASELEAYLRSRPPVRAARQIGALLKEVPPPAERSGTAAIGERPSDFIRTRSALSATPPGPPLRYDLEDGRATFVGRRVPLAKRATPRAAWVCAAGAVFVALAAWLFHGV